MHLSISTFIHSLYIEVSVKMSQSEGFLSLPTWLTKALSIKSNLTLTNKPIKLSIFTAASLAISLFTVWLMETLTTIWPFSWKEANTEPIEMIHPWIFLYVRTYQPQWVAALITTKSRIFQGWNFLLRPSKCWSLNWEITILLA